MTSGLIMTIRCAGSLPPEQSITNRRLGTPTCTAARPTPGAEYIVSNMLLTSFFKLSSNSVTGSAGASRTGFGQVTIFITDIFLFQRLLPRLGSLRSDFMRESERGQAALP